MPRSTRQFSRPSFIAQWSAISRSPGQQVDWDAVPASYEDATGTKVIPAGTVMSKLASGKVVPRADRDVVAAPTETATGLLATAAVDGAPQDAKSGYGLITGGPVYEDLLPDQGAADFGTYQTELADSGTGFRFEIQADNRGA